MSFKMLKMVPRSYQIQNKCDMILINEVGQIRRALEALFLQHHTSFGHQWKAADPVLGVL